MCGSAYWGPVSVPSGPWRTLRCSTSRYRRRPTRARKRWSSPGPRSRPRLAACAQVAGPVASMYWWDGGLERAEEWLVLLKLPVDRYDELATFLTERHSYDEPEIIALPIVTGSACVPDLDARGNPPHPGGSRMTRPGRPPRTQRPDLLRDRGPGPGPGRLVPAQRCGGGTAAEFLLPDRDPPGRREDHPMSTRWASGSPRSRVRAPAQDPGPLVEEPVPDHPPAQRTAQEGRGEDRSPLAALAEQASAGALGDRYRRSHGYFARKKLSRLHRRFEGYSRWTVSRTRPLHCAGSGRLKW